MKNDHVIPAPRCSTYLLEATNDVFVQLLRSSDSVCPIYPRMDEFVTIIDIPLMHINSLNVQHAVIIIN